MKIKHLVVALAAAALVLFLSACASNAPKPLPPAQVFQIACPPIQAAIVQFEAVDASLVGNAKAQAAGAALVKIQPMVAAACAAGATVSVANVTAFAQTVLPALGTIAGTLPLPPAQLAQVQAGLVAAEIAVGTAGVVEAQMKAAQAAQAPAAASSAK